MKKLAFVMVAALMTMIATASSGGAVTYGEPDEGEHPYVGFMIYFDPAEAAWFSCTGSLLDPATLLTAGHCTYGVGDEGGQLLDPDGEILTSGGTDMWVTFDDTNVLAGWPDRADFDTTAALYAARSAWLDDNENNYVSGTAYPHPDYDNFSGSPVNYDVGVVELDEAVTLESYAALAPWGTAETLVSGAANPNDALVESAGYGVQAIQPNPMVEESRYKSTSRIVEVKGNASRSGNLHTSNNPSEKGGRGGTCFGDSGGPVLVNDTNEIIAVVSYGRSATCHGADYSWRVDTEDSYDFITPFLGG